MVKRRRHPRVPEFPPLDQLAPGAPFNPYALFEGWSIRKAIAGAPKLRPGAKLVWLILADQVYSSDYDSHSERNLSELCALSARQFRRHLRTLGKAKLVHVAPDIGRQNYTWLLYHPLFAACSPLPPVRNVLGVRSEMSGGSGHNWPTQRNDQRNYQRSASADNRNATSSRGVVERNGRRNGEEPRSREPLPADTDNGEFVDSASPPFERTGDTPSGDATPGDSLALKRDARSFWFSLSTIEKRNRQDLARRVADRIHDLRQMAKHKDAEIARQARHEITRSLDELSGLGFTLHTTERGNA